MAESAETWRSERTVAAPKPPSRLASEIENAKLVLVFWEWLGSRLAVTIEDRGDTYVLIGRRLKGPREVPRQWSRQVAKTEEFDRLLTVLDPRHLREEDPCRRGGRDGAFQMVRATSDGNTFIRARDARGTLALEECRAFDDAFKQVMRQAGVRCEVERGCELDVGVMNGHVEPSEPASPER